MGKPDFWSKVRIAISDMVWRIFLWINRITEEEYHKQTALEEEYLAELRASESLYGFMGWLTSLEKPVTFSGYHEASLAAELVSEFCKTNDLAEPREDWTSRFEYPITRPFIDLSAVVGSPVEKKDETR